MKKKFHVFLIKPSRYDDEGYLISWWRGATVLSSSLACLYGLTKDVCRRGFLGGDVEIVPHIFDETVERFSAKKIKSRFVKKDERAVACLVGVQSNQFPRAADIAREFIAESIPSVIGGFHVSGVLGMLEIKPPEIEQALLDGIHLVAGEAESKWPDLLKDAYENRLKPIYNFLNERPSLKGVPFPVLPGSASRYFLSPQTSFDAGRGCPFHCSFCTIINVQGNAMRGRTAEDVEQIVRRTLEEAGPRIFISDDNFSRHPEWEEIADRLIQLREKKGLRFSLFLQVDAAAHRIPGFVKKMARAGVERVFIGLETVNADNLRSASKFQNRLTDYKEMLEMWHRENVMTLAGYIIGFPNDTSESVARDIAYLKKELPVDILELFVLTPLPGSVDHKEYLKTGRWLEADMNQYDSYHVCKEHETMSREVWQKTYRDAWKSFYSREHIRTLFARCPAKMKSKLFGMIVGFKVSVFLENIHPLMGGIIRLKGRRRMRPGQTPENLSSYYGKRTFELLNYFARALIIVADTWLLKIKSGQISQEYPVPNQNKSVSADLHSVTA